MKSFPKEEYYVPFFSEEDYVRKRCPKCQEYFWTQDPDQLTCEEANPSGCASYTFLGDPPTRRAYSLHEMREAFLSFFEDRGHTRTRPYPVVARWRDDIYLTHASIIDFQPYVTEGIAPPPANPLVIVQPSIRLVDIANTGPTFGRHLTIFEMGGHHAFNYPEKDVYWKDQTVRYHHEFVTQELGIRSDEVVYKEDVWIGGGNAGPDLESVVRGLEVATLVFMQYKTVNNKFVKLPIRTVDTGYGIDRYTWLSQGVVSGFHAIYGRFLDKIFQMAGLTKLDTDLMREAARLSGLVALDKTVSRLKARRKIAKALGMKVDELDRLLLPVENVFAVADHTKCLIFILSEGIVPSNIQEGYLARLLFRRVYRLLKMLGITDMLHDIVDEQIQFWSTDYPYVKAMRNEIMEILLIEEEKFLETIQRGRGLVKRIAADLRVRKLSSFPINTLTELYDSHGLPPEIVEEFARDEGLGAEVPEDFYALIAQRHEAPAKLKETKEDETVKAVLDLDETRLLYYEDQYKREFEAEIVNILDRNHVVLDRTCFFPEGGGQPSDTGHLLYDDKRVEVVDAQKIGSAIVHKTKGSLPKEKTMVRGIIDWERRYALMKNHTATHLINGAARRVLGEHVWQFGTQKNVEQSRLNISHYRRLTLKEVHEIETLANLAVSRKIPVETSWLPRGEAENLYGFRLYQGGAVPGKEIRVVKSGDWEVEACAGTHVQNTGEIGFIKITHSERVQDGVERLDYSVGLPALKAVEKSEQLLFNLSETLNSPLDRLNKTAERLVRELKETNSEKRRLIKELAARETSALVEEQEAAEIRDLGGVKILLRHFEGAVDVERMVQTANEITRKDAGIITVFYCNDEKTARLVVMAGIDATKRGVNAEQAVREASSIIGGGGGGSSNFAQGGGILVDKLPEAVKKVEELIEKQLRVCE